MSNIQTLTVAQLREVVAIKEQIEKLQSELESLVGGDGAAPVVRKGRGPGRPKKRHMSASARAAIGAAQRARWAKFKRKSSPKADAPAKKKGKRKVSKAARAKLSAIAKARWANVRATGKSKL
jgi:uncharacterized protein YceH (UPF0502 family)